MSDNLFVILGMIRAEMPEISDDAWDRIKQGLCKHASGTRVYVPTHKKRDHLIKLDALDGAPPQQVSKMLGISVRRVQQLRRLRGPSVQSYPKHVSAPHVQSGPPPIVDQQVQSNKLRFVATKEYSKLRLAAEQTEIKEFFCWGCWKWHKVETQVKRPSGQPVCGPCAKRYKNLIRRSEDARYAQRKRNAANPIWIPPESTCDDNME